MHSTLRSVGIDEVGRGPLAGPVVAGAVILPPDVDILYLNDSKKLSEKKREELYGQIMEQAVAVGLGMVGPERIDEINILQATYEAMRMAIDSLKVQPDLAVERCSDDSGSDDPSGADHQRRCKKHLHCGGQHRGKGDQGQNDERI